MSFTVPAHEFRNDTIYHQFGSESNTNIFGCGFLNKKGTDCKERNNIYQHYGIVLVLSGKATQIDNKNRISEITPGCLIQRIPDKLQTLYIEPDGSWLEFFICISKSLYDALVSMDLLDTEQNILYTGLNRAILEQCNEFLTKMKHTHPSEINLLIPEAIKFILMLHSLHKDNGISHNDKSIIRKACLLLSEPSAHEYALPNLSKDLGMGYEKFRKLFKKHTGMSPGNYIMQKRMDHAKKYLIENNKSIKEIAHEIGFSDAYSFSRQFHLSVGLSPSEFRRKY